MQHLQLRLHEDGCIDLKTWMVDSTAIRATRAASGAAYTSAQDASNVEARSSAPFGLASVQKAQCDRATVQLAEGKTSALYALRQAGKQLQGNGYTGLH